MSKIKKEELEKLQELNNKLNAVKHDLGLLETQKHSLLHLYADEVGKLEELKKELEDSYGKINIDLKDGSYEEIKEEDSGEDK